MIKENFKLAIISIKANKMRSFLTMLGIIIGVCAVITIMTVGNSMTVEVKKQLEGYGVQNITIYVYPTNWDEDLSDADWENMKLRPEAIHKLSEKFEKRISGISVVATINGGKVVENGKTAGVNVYGTSAGYYKANKVKLIKGNGFNAYDYSQGHNAAIISDKFVEQLYGKEFKPENLLGKEIEINVLDQYLDVTVVGIYHYEQEGGRDNNQNIISNVYIPLQTAWNFTNNNDFYECEVVAAEGVNAAELSTEITEYLTEVMANNLGDRFMVGAYSNQTMIEENSKTMNQITMAISLIAAIALIVGGIGVMNIMTVSITERTKEIGTRKALGAPDSMIMFQFISEAIIICLIGGIIGIILGLILGNVAVHAMGYTPHVSLASIYMSVGFSTAIGVFFGYSPAKHAANMNPIDALRYE